MYKKSQTILGLGGDQDFMMMGLITPCEQPLLLNMCYIYTPAAFMYNLGACYNLCRSKVPSSCTEEESAFFKL